MRVGPDIIQSINENQVDISSGWAFTSSDAYSPDYKEVMLQPISVEATTLDYLRFKDSVTDIVIRSGYASNSPILWSGQSFNIEENSGSVVLYHNDLCGLQGGTDGEYYHLSATQYNQLTSGGDTSLHNHSFDRNRSNHTGTQLASTISDFTSASRMLLSATTPIVYTSATGAFSHSTTGTAGTYTKVVTNATGHVTSGSVLTSADIPSLDWNKITTGKPTTLSAYGVTSADTLFDGKYATAGHNHNGLYLTSTSALNPANVVQTASYRFVTDTEKNTWNAKQNAITLGTTAQYFRGDLSLATFPTNLSSFTNDPGYLTNASSLSWSKVTGTPTTLAGYGVSASDSLFASINAGTATKLQTARTIAGVSFDGSANISIPYANLTGLPTLGTLAAKSTVTWTSDLTGVPSGLSQITNAVKNGNFRVGSTTYGSNWFGIEFSDPKSRALLINNNTGDTINMHCGIWSESEGWIFCFDKNKSLITGTVPWGSLTGVPSTFAPSAHTHLWAHITDKPTASTSTSGVLTSTDWNTFNNKASTTQLANYLPLSGGTMSGNLLGSTSYNIGASGNWWGNGYFNNLYAQNNLVWHAGNLIGNITGHYHASDRMWGNISGVPANVQNPQNYYLPLSGGTLTGSITLANNTWNAIGDDSRFGDMNVANTVGFSGIQNTNTGYIRFGTTSVAFPGTLLNDFGWDGSKFTIGTNTVWHTGNLTNLNQLTNGPGYLTNTTGDARYSLTGHLHTGQYLPLSGGTLAGPLTGTAATFSTTAVGGQGGLVQIKAPSLAANNNVSLMVGKSIASQQSGFLAWYQGATNASSYLSLHTYSGASPLEIKSTNFNLSTEGNGTFAGTISEGGTLLSSKYGRMAADNTWTGINTFGNTVDFGTQAVKFGDGSNNIKWGLNGLISVASQSSGNNAFRAGNGYWSFSPDAFQASRTYTTTTMLIAGGLEVTGKTYLKNYLKLSNGPTIAPISMAEQTYNLEQPSEVGRMVIINNTNGGPATTVTLTSTNSSFMGRTEGGAMFYAATTLTHRCVPIMLLATTATNWEVMNTFGCVSAV